MGRNRPKYKNGRWFSSKVVMQTALCRSSQEQETTPKVMSRSWTNGKPEHFRGSDYFFFTGRQDKFVPNVIASWVCEVINNACATQAIVSVLLNCEHPHIALGDALSEFKEFTHDFDAGMKGLALSNSELIRQVHNSFARQQMFEFDAKPSVKDEDAFHFVSYVPVHGRLYELDGLREGPIDLGPCSQEEWISAVRPVIEKRIQKYSEGEIRFNLMAIVTDRKRIYEEKIARLQLQLSEEEPMDTDQSSSLVSSLQSEVRKYQLFIEEENQKLKRYKVENIRRKHNYLPFIMELLKTLAEHQQLLPLVEKAKEKQNTKKAQEAK